MSDFEHFDSIGKDGEGNGASDAVSSMQYTEAEKVECGIADSENAEIQVFPPMPAEGESRKKERRAPKGYRLAVGALFLAACMLFSAVGFVGGYLFTQQLVTEERNETPLPTPTGSVANGVIYGAEGADGYDFSSVSISARDPATLTGTENGSAGDSVMTRIQAIDAVKDAVVEIFTETVSGRGQLTAGAGSGVIIHADGIIVTNHHVIDGADTIYVSLTNGSTYEAYLRGSDEQKDIAVLKITPQEALTVARLGCSAAIALGEDVFVIGNPLGELGGTVTAGIVSATAREVEMSDGNVMTLLQTDAAINSGNSGGGLFNMAGELIGVVNAKYSATGVEGLGFAIPIDTAHESVSTLLAHGYIPGIASLGVPLLETTVRYNYQLVTMPYVSESVEGSPLYKDDLIYAVNGTAVSSVSALQSIVRRYSIGDTVTLRIYREDAWMELDVTLVEYIPA